MRAFIGQMSVILAQLKPYAPLVHIAGGAIRDTLLERPVRDIDIFVGAEDHQGEITKIILKHRPDYGKVDTFEYHDHDRSVVHTATEYCAPDQVPINLIVLGKALTMDENLARFDFGICKVAYDGSRVLMTESFEHDVTNKAFTLRTCPGPTQYALSVARYERLKTKYPEFSLVIPEEFQTFATSDADALLF